MKTHNHSVVTDAPYSSSAIRHPRFSIALFLAAGLLFLARPASAQGTFDIFNNLQQPGDVFVLNNAAFVVNNIADGYQALAMPFTPGIGSNVFVNAIYIGVEDYRSGQFSSLTLSLREDNAGSPGNLIESISGNVSNLTLYAFASALKPELTGGTQYWLVTAGDPGAYGQWYTADYANASSQGTSDGTTWNADSLNYSLKVEGLATVPEPSVAFLSGLGLLITWATLRRRRN